LTEDERLEIGNKINTQVLQQNTTNTIKLITVEQTYPKKKEKEREKESTVSEQKCKYSISAKSKNMTWDREKNLPIKSNKAQTKYQTADKFKRHLQYQLKQAIKHQIKHQLEHTGPLQIKLFHNAAPVH